MPTTLAATNSPTSSPSEPGVARRDVVDGPADQDRRRERGGGRGEQRARSRARCAAGRAARAGRARSGGAWSPPTTSPRPRVARCATRLRARLPDAHLRRPPAVRASRVEPAVLVDLAVDVARLDQLVVAAAGGDRGRRSSTTISSASAIVESRWAMITRRAAPHRLAQAERGSAPRSAASTEAVASSRMRMRGSTSSARAIASRWRWPPESVTPRSPITVS